MKKRLAIFIPAYNEERSIGAVVLLAKKHGDVFVVDDGSKDRTAAVARMAGAKVIARKENGGYGAALKTAMEHAKKIDAKAFVFLDGDFQHDPDEIPAVASPVLSGKADVCVGSRFLGKVVDAPAYRKEGVALLNFLAAAQANHKTLDFQSGFRAFSKRAIEKIKINDDGYGACSEAIVSAIEAGLKVVEVPITIRYWEGQEASAIARGAGLAGRIVGEIAKRQPLFYFGLGGTALIMLSALLGVFVVERFYATKQLPIGSAILTVFSGIGGLVLILIGINLYTLGALLKRRDDDG